MARKKVGWRSGGSYYPSSGGGGSSTYRDSGQIKAGLAARQDEIDACFERSAAGPDARVTVQVSVEGSSGWVAAVEVVDETADTPLATCVAAAIAGATFETFPASTQRFTFKARLAGH